MSIPAVSLRQLPSARLAGVTLLCASAAVLLGGATARNSTLRYAFVGVLVIAVAALGVHAPKALIVGMMVWLPFLGLLRRLLLGVTAPSANDPLLLVAPAAVAFLVVLAARAGAFQQLTRLSKAVLFLSVMFVASVVNPLQGSPVVALSGLLFSLVPMLWFWAGRAFVDDALLRRVLMIVGVASALAAVYGLSQTLSGFTSFDKRWIDAQGYTALRVGGTVRAFGTFVAASDYSAYLGVALLALGGLAAKRRRTVPCLLAMVPVGWALVLASGRGVVVLVIVAAGMMLAARRRLPLWRAALAGLALFFCLSWVLGQLVSTTQFSDPRTADLLAHQVKGLSNPLSSNESSLPGHLELAAGGFRSGLSAPLGLGVGVMSQAGSKFGGVSVGTETDASNITVGLGIPGLVAYLVLAVVAFRRAQERARSRRDALSLVVLGILVVTSLQWLTGGNYAVTPVPWLALGWLDRPTGAVAEEPEPAAAGG